MLKMINMIFSEKKLHFMKYLYDKTCNIFLETKMCGGNIPEMLLLLDMEQPYYFHSELIDSMQPSNREIPQ